MEEEAPSPRLFCTGSLFCFEGERRLLGGVSRHILLGEKNDTSWGLGRLQKEHAVCPSARGGRQRGERPTKGEEEKENKRKTGDHQKTLRFTHGANAIYLRDVCNKKHNTSSYIERHLHITDIYIATCGYISGGRAPYTRGANEHTDQDVQTAEESTWALPTELPRLRISKRVSQRDTCLFNLD